MTKSSILNQYKGICSDVLNEYTAKLNKSFKSFLMETLVLYMVIPRKINFLQLGRYGESCEQRFRQNFSKDFDWLEFNLSLASKVLTGTRKAIVIDPSYISKSGKQTPWIGYFWSGCAGCAKRGLEILGVGLIDIDKKDCINLKACQTPDSITLENRNATLIDWYTLIIQSMKDEILPITKYIVADSYFSKYNFSKGIQKLGFQLISRFRDDAVLFYPTQEKSTGKRGRPKKYDGKIDFKNPDLYRMEKVNLHIDDGELYSWLTLNH